MQKLFICFSIILFSATKSYAIELMDALTSTYQVNESLKSAQQKFLSDIESFPKALGAFLPDINYSSEFTNTKANSLNEKKSLESQTNSRGVELQQNIFNGGSSAYGLKIAQARFQQSKASLYSEEQKILTEALKAYLELCEAKEKYKINVEALDFYKEVLARATEVIKLGEGTITEVADAEAAVAQAEAQKIQDANAILDAQMNFKTVIGKEPDEDVNFPMIPEDLPKDFAQFKASVERANLDLLKAKSSLSQAQNAMKQSYSGILPKADLVLSTTRSNEKSDASPRESKNTRNIGTKVVVKIPIFSHGGREYSNIREAKFANRQSFYNLDYARKQIDAEITSQWARFQSYGLVISSIEESVRAKTLAVEGMKNKYSVGLKTNLDVLKQRAELNTVKIELVRARKTYILLAYALKSLMGHMTAQNLKLKVKYFNPDYEFRNVKHKIIGF